MSVKEESLSLANSDGVKVKEKIGLTLAGAGVLILFLAFFGVKLNSTIFLTLSFLLMVSGGLIYTFSKYNHLPEGIKNNGVWFDSLSNRGAVGWVFGIILTGFYILLYWFNSYLGVGTGADGANEGLVALFDPLCMLMKGKPANHWFVYGTMYTMAILILGVKFIYKYRHNRYQLIRTIVVMLSQFLLAYMIPEVLEGFNSGTPYFTKDLKQIWPLNYYIVEDWYLDAMQVKQAVGPSGLFYFFWALILFLIITPVLTYYVGKRWYCSWICGCGGLAETAGDNFRQLSSKKLSAWKLERWVVHSVMIFVLLMSVAVFYTYFSGKEFNIKLFTIDQATYVKWTIGFLAVSLGLLILTYFIWSKRNKFVLVGVGIIALLLWSVSSAYITGSSEIFFIESKSLKSWYGFYIGAAFSGVIGVGFYPVLGNRIWCRFGCPMAGYMGIIQRFKSKFRITTNGGQCISCGNCSTYCEQGIDVRAYAQKGQNIVRASCVGCGVCSAVCPRGVLKLENGPDEDRMDEPVLIIGTEKVELNREVFD